jgi:hypothetical protein
MDVSVVDFPIGMDMDKALEVSVFYAAKKRNMLRQV